MTFNRSQFLRNFCLFVFLFNLLLNVSFATTPEKPSARPLSPLLRCHVTYAGSTQVIDSMLSKDPYSVNLHDIAGRFQFKAVMIGNAQNIEYIKLYAYRQSDSRDFPIHQATFLPPFKLSKVANPLTPINYLYAGEAERELQYQCTLQGIKK